MLVLSGWNKVVGSVQLLPATSSTLLGALFPVIGNSGLLKPHATIVESSRFCVDTSHEIGRAGEVLHNATWTMFAAIIKSSMSGLFRARQNNGSAHRVNPAPRRLADNTDPRAQGGRNTTAVVGLLPTDLTSLERVRPVGYPSMIGTIARAA
ncbi:MULTISPECIES: acyl-homoserine-lactone synthase [Hyphomicrobiales]|uniref:acyl-homoserine-lactone synthase n=1 Tax=Hyphomicrobiales TaxID=356 RepID=UPI002477DD18|nr:MULTISPECIES: acyl-homoserine-lactone synthase [Hyphomicrobiales]MDX3804873.1 acyl-homoserine-lactone synthase [Bosea sp. (in: a-proteobacteria)]